MEGSGMSERQVVRVADDCLNCESGNQFEVIPVPDQGDGSRLQCCKCGFVLNFVRFSCGCCAPDLHQRCPMRNCMSNGRGSRSDVPCQPRTT